MLTVFQEIFVVTYRLASLTITVTISPVTAVWSGALLVHSPDLFLHRLLFFPAPWHLSPLIPSPLFTDFLVELDPVFHQALLGTVLDGPTFRAAVRVSAVLETIVTKLGVGDKLAILG